MEAAGNVWATMRRRKALSACLLFALTLRFSQRLRRAIVLAVVRTESGSMAALHLTRVLLGTVFPPILVNWWFVWPGHIAHDGMQVLHNLEYKRGVRFGPHERETLDSLKPLRDVEHQPEPRPLQFSGLAHMCWELGKELVEWGLSGVPPPQTLVPSAQVQDDAPAILYGHGGGWVCQGTDVQLQQLTPIARAGFAVFAFNYPLAPEDPFPAALVTTLRAVSWLKTKHGRSRVALVGESAGGNLVAQAAALLSNRELLQELGVEIGVPLHEWDFPDVTCVVSWYSILCDEHWKDDEEGWLAEGLERVVQMYKCPKNTFGNRYALLDLEAHLAVYPPALFVGATQDPLGLAASAKAAHNMLSQKQLQSELLLFDDTHGFIGFPVQMQQAFHGGEDRHWRANALGAMEETVRFLKRHHSADAFE